MAFYPQYNNLTDQQIKAASWWLNNQGKVKLGSFLLLALITAFVFGSTVFNIVIYFTVQKPKLIQAEQKFWTITDKVIQVPAPVVVEPAAYFFNINGTIDVASKVVNNNETWEVTALRYHFVIDGLQTSSSQIYLGPKQTGLISYVGLKWTNGAPQKIEVAIEPNWQKIENPPAMVRAQDVVFNKVGPATQVEWMTTNDTLRAYWSVPFVVIGYSQGQPVALNMVSVEKLKFQEQRKTIASWFNELPVLDQVEVFPLFDPYNNRNWWTGE